MMHLYAELLLHIQTVTVFVSLSNTSTALSTHVYLSEDRLHFVLHHGGKISKLRLPARIASSVPLVQPIPRNASDQLTFRLPLESTSRHLHNDPDILTPWSANEMNHFECIHCKTCKRNIVRPFKIDIWKDLPSENWAEMMDFWHCHKPHVEGQNGETSTKGYSAANRLTAQPGVGFVDTSTFVLSWQDCSSVKVVNAINVQSSHPDIVCDRCDNFVGVEDDQAVGLRLFKSQLAIGFRGSVQLHQYALELWIGTIFLSAAEAQATKRFVVRDNKSQARSILIWIFTPDLWISSSVTPEMSSISTESGPMRAMKILWKEFRAPERASETEINQPECLDLTLPQFQSLEEALSTNQFLIPSSARRYQDWHVSFLHRFSLKDVHGAKNVFSTELS